MDTFWRWLIILVLLAAVGGLLWNNYGGNFGKPYAFVYVNGGAVYSNFKQSFFGRAEEILQISSPTGEVEFFILRPLGGEISLLEIRGKVIVSVRDGVVDKSAQQKFGAAFDRAKEELQIDSLMRSLLGLPQSENEKNGRKNYGEPETNPPPEKKQSPQKS